MVSASRKTSQFIVRCMLILDPSNCKHVDCGATVCKLTKSLIGETQSGETQIESCNVSLEMWNKVKINPLGTYKVVLENLKTLLKYMVKFVVVEEDLNPFVRLKAAEKMELITVNYERFESVE